jgi:uncharacterized alkaline shock family protein YloU
MPYVRPIPNVTKEMRDNVTCRAERLISPEVTEVAITVRGAFFPEQQ